MAVARVRAGASSGRALRLAVASAAVVAAAAPLRPASSQQQPQTLASVYAAAFQYGDSDPSPFGGTPANTWFQTFHPDCTTAAWGSTGFLSAGGPCDWDATGPNGTANRLANGAFGPYGTARTLAVGQFVPGSASMKVQGSVDANGFTLGQFVPQYDPVTGDRIFTDQLRPDVLGAMAQVSLTDQLQLSHSAGVVPATMSLFVHVDGSMYVPGVVGASNLLFSMAQTYLGFCTGPTGACSDMDGTNQFSGIASLTSYGSVGSATMYMDGSAPSTGGVTPTVTFAGSVQETGTTNGHGSLTQLNGVFTLGNIPVASLNSYDFNFVFATYAQLHHQTHQMEPCDPAFVPGCYVYPSDDATGMVNSDFSHTLTFSGYQVFDGAGNDITAQAQLTFGSGIVPGATITPEPATLALVAGGLLSLGIVARRRTA